MLVATAAAASLPVCIWTYLLVARGGFWREPSRVEMGPPSLGGGTRQSNGQKIVAVIPARDEAPVIGTAVESLLTQRFSGSIHVIVVDDGSSDGTAAAAIAAATAVGASSRLTVIRGAALPAGWTGKLWAMSQGVTASAAWSPDYLLFTDADIHHGPDSIGSLVASAESGGLDLTSRMVRLSTATLAERVLIPAFVFFFFMLYPPRWIASSRRRTAGAAGGCMLVRPQALDRIGGFASIRTQIIDDCALASAMKACGCSLSLALGKGARSIRSYGGFGGVGHMISRSAFNQLRHSYGLLAATLAGLTITFLAPPLLVASGRPIPVLLGASAWALMTFAYAPMVRLYGRSVFWSLALPAVAVFYAGATLHSALQYRRGRGGRWKNRVQDLSA